MNKPTDEPQFPERLYLERWPDRANRDDQVFYEPTGAGIDMRTGAESTVAVYVRSNRDDIAQGWRECIEALRAIQANPMATPDHCEADTTEAGAFADYLERLMKERA